MEGDRKRRQASVCDGGSDQDKNVLGKIMQRFRPIAPKPTTVGGESSDNAKSSRFLGRNRRSKRKYVRVRNKNISSGSNSNSNNNKDRILIKNNGYNGETIKNDDDKEIVTLQLLPEKDKDPRSDENQDSTLGPSSRLDQTVVVESWLTVECVSDTCSTNLEGFHISELSRMDQGEERVMRILEVDTCPWLISDELNRVCWVNQSYRRMMGDPEADVIKVWLVVTMELIEEMRCMVELYGAVTCRVRVRIRYEPSTLEVKMTMPCDLWRMGSGGFAWRLDVQSALTLGR